MKRFIIGGLAALAIAAIPGPGLTRPGVSGARLLPRRRWWIRLVRLLRRPDYPDGSYDHTCCLRWVAGCPAGVPARSGQPGDPAAVGARTTVPFSK